MIGDDEQDNGNGIICYVVEIIWGDCCRGSTGSLDLGSLGQREEERCIGPEMEGTLGFAEEDCSLEVDLRIPDC